MTPTQHLERFDEKFLYTDGLGLTSWNTEDPDYKAIKQHLIQTVISVLEDQVKELEVLLESPPPYSAVINNPMMHCYQNQGYIQGLVNAHGLIEKTLSTWNELLEE